MIIQIIVHSQKIDQKINYYFTQRKNAFNTTVTHRLTPNYRHNYYNTLVAIYILGIPECRL